jgi:hypothetical protein
MHHFGVFRKVTKMVHCSMAHTYSGSCRLSGVETLQSQGKIEHLFRNFFGAFFGTKAALKMG